MPEARTGATSVAAVMVNFRTPVLALDAARALASARAEFPDLRLVIADGFSNDDSVERLEAGVAGSDLADWVTVLPLAVNGGFGWANNQAMLRLMQSDSPPDYIYLLNPDTQVTPGAVSALVETLDRYPRCAAVGSLLLNDDGSPSGSAFRFPSVGRELLRGARTGGIGRLLGIEPIVFDDGHAGEVDWVTGASMMFRAAALKQTGLFDTAFFLYFEEVELTHRLRKAGWTVRHEPASKVHHIGGASTGMAYNRKDLTIGPPLPRYWFRSRRRCFSLIGGRSTAIAANLAWITGHAFYMTRRMIGRGGYHILNRREGRDLIGCGVLPSRADVTSDHTAWDEPFDRTPAWMQRSKSI
ncbi:glycosyltransferase family 2 protein [Sphingomonas aliaeris]|uniref:Glycosyltransferase family 2 protein n=1 Tax=Sphingomonas aliaeris TaxID=2759526 RepID=A0A974NW71_9SPHN|nr:glycosyltransferase family 2 protein [Sphingomonas aliaeris]QQV78066.1 glycosyltransferase family 2 protein [Sphingomonas aliaeris]